MEGKKLRSLIRDSGITQGDIASKLQMSRQTLSNHFRSAEVPQELISKIKDIIPQAFSGLAIGGLDMVVEPDEQYIKSKLSKEDLLKIRNNNGLSQQEFADLIGISLVMYGLMERGEKPISRKTELIIDELGRNNRILTSPPVGVPVYDVDFSAGFVELIRDLRVTVIGNLNIPEVNGCDYVIRAKGESMSDFINDRDWIGIKRINDMDIIAYGNPYAIVTSELQLLKYIIKCEDKESFCLSSHNKNFEDYTIPRSKVKELYIVRAVLPFSRVKTLI